MNESDLKNMVVLRNLPSNIVEEAFIVLKGNKKIKNLEKVEKSTNKEKIKSETKENDYILKEAEMLISNYISTLEEKKSKQTLSQKKTNQKYKRVKNYAYLTSLIILIETMLLLIR